MSLRDLTPGDFDFWKKYAGKMRDCHEKEFLQEVDPAILRCLYRGRRKEIKDSQGASKRDDLVTLNRIFTTTNTVLSNTYNQNPMKLAKPMNGADPDEAALMTSVLNYYTRTTKQKVENQEAIMNAWFFGLGWKKVGYHIAVESDVKEPEAKLSIGDRAALGIKSILGIEPELTQHKDSQDFVRYETLVNTSEDPANVHIDHRGTIHNFKVINHHVKRTLHELLTFNNYEPEVISEIKRKFEVKMGGNRFDIRDIEVTLNEMMIEQRNGIWILAFVDEYDKPLRYERMSFEGKMPWAPLVLTNEPGIRYPTSHMKVASNVQQWIDNLANLQIEQLGKMRNQHYINQNLLAPGQEKALRQNKIGGFVLGKRPATAGDITEIASRQIGSDQFAVLQMFQQSLTEIMGSTEQRVSGKSKNRTATQDQLAEAGGQIRESGILDRIGDWMVDQTELEGGFIKQYSNATLHLQISPKDFARREDGESVETQWVEFMTERNPLPLRHYIEGQFSYVVNAYEAVKPTNPNIRNEYLQALQILAPLQNTMIQSGARVRIEEIARKIGDTFEHIQGDDLIEILDSRQQAAFQAAEALKARGGAVPQELGGGSVEKEPATGEV